jgi:hypothetical protein
VEHGLVEENRGVVKGVPIPTRPHFGVIAMAPKRSRVDCREAIGIQNCAVPQFKIFPLIGHRRAQACSVRPRDSVILRSKSFVDMSRGEPRSDPAAARI